MAAVAIIALLLVIVGWKCVTVVPDGSAWVVERLGRYHRTLPPGRHVLAPFVDQIRFRYSTEAREEQLSDVCITRDNVPIRVTSIVRARISDPRQAAYASASAGDFVVTLVRTHQRDWIAARAWNDVRESTREMEAAVEEAVHEPAAQAGIEILALEVQSIERVES
jgi:regulator of protease activity HflC (stomatin/prohibitin superfamily)